LLVHIHIDQCLVAGDIGDIGDICECESNADMIEVDANGTKMHYTLELVEVSTLCVPT